eukprot:609510-Prymnesium_polylepis.1
MPVMKVGPAWRSGTQTLKGVCGERSRTRCTGWESVRWAGTSDLNGIFGGSCEIARDSARSCWI